MKSRKKTAIKIVQTALRGNRKAVPVVWVITDCHAEANRQLKRLRRQHPDATFVKLGET